MTLLEAIAWKWPGARCVVRGGVLERWDGPMARPSDAEIAQAVTDYALVAAQVQADAEVDAKLAALDGGLLEALLEALPAMQTDLAAGTFKRGEWRQRLRGRMKTLRRHTP